MFSTNVINKGVLDHEGFFKSILAFAMSKNTLTGTLGLNLCSLVSEIFKDRRNQCNIQKAK